MEPIDPRVITPKDIESLTLKHPIVYACLVRFKNGQLTWEQTLMWMVLCFAELSDSQDKILYDMLSWKPEYQQMARVLSERCKVLQAELDAKLIDEVTCLRMAQ